MRYVIAMLLLAGIARAEEGAKQVADAWTKAMKANSIDGAMACYANNRTVSG